MQLSQTTFCDHSTEAQLCESANDKIEVLFHNEALIRLFDVEANNVELGLTQLIEKQVFTSSTLRNPISLRNIAQKRYSDFVLSQIFQYADVQKMLTFQRYDIFFNNHMSILLNLRLV